jgi:hypothetical protein
MFGVETPFEETRDCKELVAIGHEQGRQAEAAALLLPLAARRFGPVPAGLGERIHALPLERLEALAEAILDLDGLNRLETWLGDP